MMDYLDMALLIFSAATFLPYVCRLNLLHYKTHKLRIIILHGALAAGAATAGLHAWQGDVGVLEWASVIAAASWIVTSFKTWGKGDVPLQFTKSGELGPAELQHVSGGRRE